MNNLLISTIVIVAIVALLLVFYVRRGKGESSAAISAGSGYQVVDVYEDLRKQALELKHHDTGAGVIAVLMETGYPEAVASLLAVNDGTASLYFSNGGGVIGAGEHEPVRALAIAMVTAAAEYVSKAEPAETYPLPREGRVRFYLVTGEGVFTIEASEDDLGYERHGFSPLFHLGHELIAAIRQHSPD